MKNNEFCLCGIIVAAAFILSACSDDNPPQTNNTPPAGDNVTIPAPLPLDVPNGFTSDGKTFGMGPAFSGQRPPKESLGTETEYDGTLTIHSGQWRGAGDGSAGAGDIISFIESFRPDGEDGFVIPDLGSQKTLRISGATDEQKKAVENALRLINAALPFDKRIKLGPPVTTFDRRGVPDNEIHIHFTEGKTGDWPVGEEGNGLGKAKVDASHVVLSGYALIDTDGVAEDNADLQGIITRELLRAYGIVVHAEDATFPDSTLLLSSAHPVYLSLYGETLLAITTLTPGTDVGDLSSVDLGNWNETAFHLLGELDLGEDQTIAFGAGFRNGLGKPWAHGPVPETTLADNADLTGTVTWLGYLLGFTNDGNTVTGEAEIEMNFTPDTPTGTAVFTGLETWGTTSHPGKDGDGTTWSGGDISYPIEIVKEGTFEGFKSTTQNAGDLSEVSGAFVGREHEGAVGTVERSDLSAGFGAER
ncbi:MAG: hypothetical protein OXH65_00685 [Paracoccaceae bacterium]|nr:hypothetical protein [Paracoccaceae bacterium]MDE2673606.1 hypothetical protein [Paracoccaceae bacterium]MDE2739851.1 hypothetical protein [Paracoccaceae bacterium]